MYYLTYRPRTIEEIDNVAPRETIKKILESKSLPHAFLFVGQKGTGKTSTARIVAKSLNCINNVVYPEDALLRRKDVDLGSKKAFFREPCNTCANCKSIDSSSFPDVLEMDAASNRGINEVKNLIKESSFLPIAGKYRIFIIDEAHMITPDGFNALLKTLEEPPSTVIFILATTNPEKVPKTIMSRCVNVTFGKAKKAELLHMLHRIVTLEKLKVAPDVLDLISHHADGSFRDAAKLLEELVMQNKLEMDEVLGYLGVRSKESLLHTLHTKDVHAALIWIEEFANAGGSFKNLIEELLGQLHDLLLSKHKIGEGHLNPPFSLPEITLLMKLFTEAYISLRNSPIESIPLEIAVIEFYNKRVTK